MQSVNLDGTIPQWNQAPLIAFAGRQKLLQYSKKNYLSCFKMAIKEHLFPVYKFCTQARDLYYTTDPESVCQIVLRHTDLQPDEYLIYWQAFQGIVKTELTLKRNNVIGQLKRKFKGKL